MHGWPLQSHACSVVGGVRRDPKNALGELSLERLQLLQKCGIHNPCFGTTVLNSTLGGKGVESAMKDSAASRKERISGLLDILLDPLGTGGTTMPPSI